MENKLMSKKENPDFENRSNSSEGAEEETLPKEGLSLQIRNLQDEFESKKKEYNDLHDKYLRVVADFDNYKKRVEKEKAEIIDYGNEELIKELLPVLDSLE